MKHAHAIHANAGADRPAIENTFKSLHLAEPLLKALHEEGYDNPTPIQAQSIPLIMASKDVLGCAQTGTGKTAAFAVPILHRLMQDAPDKSRKGPALPRVLVLSPTRELATQIGDSFATYGRHTGLVHTVIFGGVSQFHQVKALHKGVDILVATPGRLIDLMEQRLVTLSSVKIFVLDEADRMLDMGFIKPIQRIAAAIPKGVTQRQTLLFSATMPREIQHLADALLHNPAKVSVTPVSSAAPLIEQQLFHVHKLQKQALLTHLLEEHDSQRAVVFTKTKHGADKVQRKLNQSGITAEAIHGNKAQNYRTRALAAFRDGRSRVLVATDVAARGLDVDDVTHVFNYDLPMEPEAYVHRIGRTGRMGKQGLAISFCDAEERDLLRQIERLTGKKIPNQVLPPLPSVAELASTAEAKKAEWEAKQFAPRGGGHRGEGGPRDSHSQRKPHRGQGGSSGERGGASRNADFPVMRTSGDDHGNSRNAARPARGWNKPRGRR